MSRSNDSGFFPIKLRAKRHFARARPVEVTSPQCEQLMISAEARPLRQADALVDVLDASPHELRQRDHEVSVVLPFIARFARTTKWQPRASACYDFLCYKYSTEAFRDAIKRARAKFFASRCLDKTDGPARWSAIFHGRWRPKVTRKFTRNWSAPAKKRLRSDCRSFGSGSV